MKNRPQDGTNRRDRQQHDPERRERQDLSPKQGNKQGERRQQEPGVKERRDFSPNPGNPQGGQRSNREQQEPRKQERQDYTPTPERPGERREDRPNTQQKFPGGKDRDESERMKGDRDTQFKPRRQDEGADSKEPSQEPYMGRKHEE